MSRYTIFRTRTPMLVLTLLLLALLASACDGRAATSTPTPTPASAVVEVAEAGIPESLLTPGTGGANVWIEFPLEGQLLPETATTFVVYASSAGGVEAITLSLNGEPMSAGSLKDLSNNGDGSMVRLEQTWQPPGPGEYTLTAQAGSTSSSITFCVVHCGVDFDVQPTETSTPTPAPQDIQFWADPTSFPAGGCTTLHWKVPSDAQMVSLGNKLIDFANVSSQKECMCQGRAYKLSVLLADNTTEERQLIVTVTGDCTQPDTPEPILKFWAEPETIAAGECTTLNWEAEGYETITLHAQSVAFAGTDQKCPCEGTTYPITGTKKDGSTDERTVTIAVNGACEVPETVPPEEPPPTDTTGPEYVWVDTLFEDCKFTGAAEISDPSGVSWAKFHFNLNNEGWKSLWMKDIGGGVWEAEAAISVMEEIGTPIGEIEYRIESADTLNNQSSIQTTRTYNSCSG
jgi:hypothetical protein